MSLYGAYYYSIGRKMETEIEADDEQHAQLLLSTRRLGERLEDRIVTKTDIMGLSYFLLQQEVTPDLLTAALHEATFLGYVALSSGAATPREILGDHGIVHELAHIVSGDNYDVTRRLERVCELARDIQRRVPGWPVCN